MATQALRRPRRRRVRLDEQLPVDHRLNQVYRIGAGVMGLILIVFGILGLIDKIGFFDTGGDRVAGLNTNGALSVLSICVGLLLLAGMVVGGNIASTLNMVLGVLFIASGFVNLALLDTSYNILAFHIQNVLFSFVVGVVLMFFGMYGRVSGSLPHDNPYWRARHPEQAELEERVRAKIEHVRSHGHGYGHPHLHMHPHHPHNTHHPQEPQQTQQAQPAEQAQHQPDTTGS
ncbi:DUF4383 domain-containing protein [Streptomyces odonnellii]|uniref:DUF4383 domain-containing protein n=1 Tax=Streptomyces odonnellii TaxID=1417980 RepID=UPI00099BED8C|nr:DUF4383 domain-containing protein [Streptomyces odonnellii]